MNWSERLNVLTGVAKAVHFLHTGVIPGFFSNRLKTNNVLLNQHRFAKLSDYGLSIVSEATRHNTVKLVTFCICFCFKFPIFFLLNQSSKTKPRLLAQMCEREPSVLVFN